jgi:hypothetical protein
LNLPLLIKKYILLLSSLSLLSSIFYSVQALAQEDSNEKFFNIGPISISDLYTIPSEKNNIIFRIKNNTSRTISQIYGWAYKFDKGPDGKTKNFVLLNNPHKGGMIFKGKPHRPGTVSEWSFPLVRKPSITSPETSYTLRVHSRSIFFASIEQRKKSSTEP